MRETAGCDVLDALTERLSPSDSQSLLLEVNIADGGLVPWTQQILGNRKERLMISGLGIELLATKLEALTGGVR